MTYPGGKSGAGVYQKIINQIPPHKTYIELFLGSGAIMRLKKPAHFNIGVDIDKSVIDRFDFYIPNLQLINESALDWLASIAISGDTAGDFIYLDPPYLMETRKTKKPIYRYEFYGRSEHRQLLEQILGLSCMVAISGYYSDLYMDYLKAWRYISFDTVTRAGTMATEYLWMNYPAPTRLHDYRYLGENFRERERITRIKNRWVNRLKNMGELERCLLLAAMDEIN